MEKKRLFCVDLLRGLDIFYLLAIHYGILAGGVFKVWPLESERAKAFWLHSTTAFQSAPGAATTGFGILDFTQPLFVFVTGVSASLAAAKFSTPDGFDLRAFFKRLASRTLMLWALGSLIRGALEFKLFSGRPELPSFVFYSDTLHTIAVAYLAASAGLLCRRRTARLALGAGLVAATALAIAFFGDYSRLGNAARLLEDAAYAGIGGRAKDFCYLLTTFTWAGMGILASLAGDVLKSNLPPRRKAAVMFAAGAASFALGCVLSLRIPPIRYIYTASFVFETLGLSAMLLSALYVLTDILRLRRRTWIFVLYGQCSLAAWMLMNFFGDALSSAARKIVCGVPALTGSAECGTICAALAKVAILTYLIWQWRRLRRLRGQKPA